MSPAALDGANRRAIDLRNEDAVVFIDETGHDQFHDPKYPVFGWGGCAMSVPAYRDVDRAWRSLKQTHFPNVPVMHAATLKPTQEQAAAVGEFFQTQTFGRFAAVTRRDAQFEFPVLNSMAGALVKRVEEVIRHFAFNRVLVIYEAGHTWDEKVRAMFGSLRMQEEGIDIPIEQGFMAKAHAEPGLEIADFVVHAAGGMARTENWERKDYEAVFRGRVDERLAACMLVQSVARTVTGP